MAFEDLKEKLKDQWADLSSKIQENSTFNNLREKFEGQTPVVQRAIIGGCATLAVLFLLSFPWGYLSDSIDHVTTFEENRGLIQGLLRASRAAKEPSPLPPATPIDSLKSRIEGMLHENRLIPEQIGVIQPLPANPAKDLVPSVVVQAGLVVQLKKLNLDQIMNLSHQLQTMDAGTKLMGLDIVESNGQTHYYDLIARVVSFSLPPVTIPDTDGKVKGKGDKRASKRNKTDEETPE